MNNNVENKEQKNNVIYTNSLNITGNIASMSDVRLKSNGKKFMYLDIAQNSRDGKASFYSIYLDGVMLDKFQEMGLKVGDRINAQGRLDSFQKDSKNTYQIKPFTLNKIEYQKTREMEKDIQKENTNEISM